MLKPADIAVGNYTTALKPTLGYELQLYVSPKGYTNLGTISVVAPNSGVWTPTTAGASQLLATPQQVLAKLDVSADVGGTVPTDLVVNLTGTNQTGAAMTGTFTFTPPGFANDQSRAFPRGWSADGTLSIAGSKWKTITGVSVTTDAGLATAPNIILCGVPDLDYSASGSFKKIGTKVKLDFDPAAPVPTAIQDGRVKGAYIKPGEIEVGTLNISAKVPSAGDGLSRYNGLPVTGWIVEKKEDVLVTQHILLLGLVMTTKPSAGEGAEPVTWESAASLYEQFAMIVAH